LRERVPTVFPATTLFRSGRAIGVVIGESQRLGLGEDGPGPSRFPQTQDRRGVLGQPGQQCRGQPVLEVQSQLLGAPGIRGSRIEDRKSTRLNSSHVSISY